MDRLSVKGSSSNDKALFVRQHGDVVVGADSGWSNEAIAWWRSDRS